MEKLNERKIEVVIKEGDKVTTHEDYDFVMVVALNDLGDSTACKVAMEGMASNADIAHAIISIHDSFEPKKRADIEAMMLVEYMMRRAKNKAHKEDSDGE